MSMIGNYCRVSPEQLTQLRAAPETIADFLYPENDEPLENHLDIDKTWHAIHFLLNGHIWEGKPPLFLAVLGGVELGEEDVGYGPARFLLPEEVCQLSAALNDISAAQLLARYDPIALNKAEIYPQMWSDDREDREYIAAYYEKLVVLAREACEAGDALLLWIN